MSMADFPPVADVLPHSGDMVLLSKILSHDADETVCMAEVDRQALFRDAAGEVGAWLGLEFMAQCIGAHAGLAARGRGEDPTLGFLLGSRRVHFHCARYLRGQSLRVRASHRWGEAPGLVSFECSIEDAATHACLAEGRLSCFLPEDASGLEEMP